MNKLTVLTIVLLSSLASAAPFLTGQNPFSKVPVYINGKGGIYVSPFGNISGSTGSGGGGSMTWPPQ